LLLLVVVLALIDYEVRFFVVPDSNTLLPGYCLPITTPPRRSNHLINEEWDQKIDYISMTVP
jgi:hypothetical protein